MSAFRPQARPLGRALKILFVCLAFHILFPEGSMAAEARTIRVTALGDSLTAGWGLPESQSWPRLVEERLRRDGFAVQVVNAGVSGDTTAAGRTRLGWALTPPPQIVAVALGANDALRGQDPGQAKANLAAILETLKTRGIRTLLVGMLAPPNLGREYERQFNAIFTDLAARYDVPLVPFLLEGVAGRPELNQADGIHPTAEGQRIMADLLYPHVRRLVEDVQAAP